MMLKSTKQFIEFFLQYILGLYGCRKCAGGTTSLVSGPGRL